jgi:hypothetical protein
MVVHIHFWFFHHGKTYTKFCSSAEAEADQKQLEAEEVTTFSALYAPVRALFCADPQLLEELGQCSTHLERIQLLSTLQVLGHTHGLNNY